MNNNPPLETDSGGNSNVVIAIVSSILLSLLFCICCKSRTRRLSEEELQEQDKQDRLEDPNYRQYLIKRALFVRQVTSADPEQGRLTLGKVLQQQQQQEEEKLSQDEMTSPSGQMLDDDTIDYDDPSIPCCSVCLEPYRVGEIVAWRRDTPLDKKNITKGDDKEPSPCVHVFHQDCIVPWLENPSHDDCPSCRTILLKPSWDEDRQDGDSNSDNGNENEGQQRTRQGTRLRLSIHRAISRVRRSHRRDGASYEDNEQASSAASSTEDANSSTGHSTGGSIFEIVHGLVSRVHRASFSLTGQDDAAAAAVAATDPAAAPAADPAADPAAGPRSDAQHQSEPKLSNLMASTTFNTSYASSSDSDDEEINRKGDLLLSGEDSVLWEGIRFSQTVESHGNEDEGTAEV